MRLFLCGDVMTGRGIDQALPHPVHPNLYEPYVRDAREYVALAEKASGPIPRPLSFEYIWGDALAELELGKGSKEGILYVRFHGFSLGVELKEGTRDLKVFRPLHWFQDQREHRRLQHP